MEWLYTEAMLLFFSAKSLFFMVCQLRIIIPKKRGNGTESLALISFSNEKALPTIKLSNKERAYSPF